GGLPACRRLLLAISKSEQSFWACPIFSGKRRKSGADHSDVRSDQGAQVGAVGCNILEALEGVNDRACQLSRREVEGRSVNSVLQDVSNQTFEGLVAGADGFEAEVEHVARVGVRLHQLVPLGRPGVAGVQELLIDR